MRDDLGNRMKQYEAVSSGQLLRRCPVIVRVDGRAFHTWTRGLDRPFDLRLIAWMRQATEYTAARMQGCKLAFTQSDETSFLLTDYDNLETQPWFGYDLAKVVSLSASIFTGAFNGAAWDTPHVSGLAEFDARAFNVPADDVANYFLWRAKDWRRNAIQMVAQSMFSPKELYGVKLDVVQEMILAKAGVAWNRSLPDAIERGGWFLPQHLEWIEGPEPNFGAVSEVVELALRSMGGNGDGKMNDAASDVPGEQTADQEEAFQGRHTDPVDRICSPEWGCRGYGYLDDLTDSGSGAMVYCGCPAGTNLKATDEARLSRKLRENFWPPDFGPGRRDELAEERARRYVREDGTPK